MSVPGRKNSISSIFEDELDYERSGYQVPQPMDALVRAKLV